MTRLWPEKEGHTNVDQPGLGKNQGGGKKGLKDRLGEGSKKSTQLTYAQRA